MFANAKVHFPPGENGPRQDFLMSFPLEGSRWTWLGSLIKQPNCPRLGVGGTHRATLQWLFEPLKTKPVRENTSPATGSCFFRAVDWKNTMQTIYSYITSIPLYLMTAIYVMAMMAMILLSDNNRMSKLKHLFRFVRGRA